MYVIHRYMYMMNIFYITSSYDTGYNFRTCQWVWKKCGTKKNGII